MKTLAALSACCVLLAGGCATTRDTTGSLAPSQAAPARAVSKVVTDSEYMARVEALALRRGVQVQWVNAPKKRTVEN